MRAKSWGLGLLEWLIGAAVLPPSSFLGKWLFNRRTAKRSPATGGSNLTPSFSSMPPAKKSSLPTADDLQDTYDLLPIGYRADLLRNHVGLNVRWLGFLVGAYVRPEAPEYAYMYFRFDGERTNSALFRCQVKVADYPVVEDAKQTEAKAWVKGEIAGIEDSSITLTNPNVKFL